MYTIEDYLNSLKNDKSKLKDNLEEKGITGLSGDETFTELVPEVLNIKQSDLGEYFTDTIPSGSSNAGGIINSIKKLPDNITLSGNPSYLFARASALEEAPIIDFSGQTNITGLFYYCANLKNIPLYNFSSVTLCNSAFSNCISLISVPEFNLSSCTQFSTAFNGCSNLENVPLFNTPSATDFDRMFQNCPKLTNESIDNILQMCISATNYSSTKTLRYMGFNSSSYSASRIQALPHYQNFINAGWTIGY